MALAGLRVELSSGRVDCLELASWRCSRLGPIGKKGKLVSSAGDRPAPLPRNADDLGGRSSPSTKRPAPATSD